VSQRVRNSGRRSTYTRVWREVPAAGAPIQPRRPHRLAWAPVRPTPRGVSLWLDAVVPATEVAERAGHSVDLLLRLHARVHPRPAPVRLTGIRSTDRRAYEGYVAALLW